MANTLKSVPTRVVGPRAVSKFYRVLECQRQSDCHSKSGISEWLSCRKAIYKWLSARVVGRASAGKRTGVTGTSPHSSQFLRQGRDFKTLVGIVDRGMFKRELRGAYSRTARCHQDYFPIQQRLRPLFVHDTNCVGSTNEAVP
jgi:hypothetical protein